LINKHFKNIKSFRREIIISQIVRDLINLMVVDVINTTNKNLKKSSPQSINDIYKPEIPKPKRDMKKERKEYEQKYLARHLKQRKTKPKNKKLFDLNKNY